MLLAAWKLDELLHPLVLFGFAGQFVFMLRFIVQWYVSEKRGRSVIPMSFWYISLVGGLILFVYAVLRRDPVFTLAQALGLLIYSRNIWITLRRRARYLALRRGSAARPGASPRS